MSARRRSAGAVVALVALAATAAACAGGDDDAAGTPPGTAAPSEVATTDAGAATVASTAAPTTAPRTTSTTAAPAPTTTSAPSTTTTVATTDAPGTTAVPATAAPDVVTVPDDEITLGSSVEGRPITVIRRGVPADTDVLVVGVIHGNEAAGSAIVDLLRMLPVPGGVELWLVPSANPDGQAAGIRHNANGVDLNRNFPENWGPVAEAGNWQWAGPGPASEPETQAMLTLTELVEPDLTLWYHQDLFRISPSTGREGAVRARYAELTGLPLVEVTGGTYTGTASTWSRSIADDGGVGFTVELGDTLPPDDARRHADAVLQVATEL